MSVERRACSPSFYKIIFLPWCQNSFLKGAFLVFTRRKCEVVVNIFINEKSMKMLMEVEQTRTEHGSPGLEGALVVDLPLTPSVILEKLLENLYLFFFLLI